MRLPDGYVFVLDVDRKGVNINVTEIELVRCKHCTHCFEIETIGPSFFDVQTKFRGNQNSRWIRMVLLWKEG